MHRPLIVALAALAATPALATEVQFEGDYRARGRAFSDLSMGAGGDELAEGLRAWGQHRLLLRPRFVLSDKVALFTEIRALDGAAWGSSAAAEDDPNGTTTCVDCETLPTVFTDDLRAPSSLTADGLPRAVPDISIWRAYGQVHGKAGTFRFGRMPVHWGLGVWQNDGHGMNADYGDSVDRVQWDKAIDDIFLRAAFEVDSYGLVSDTARDAISGNLAAAYRSERIELGLNAQVRRVFAGDVDDPLTIATGSLAADAELGNLHVGVEIVGRYGSGALDADLNDVDIQALGGVLVGELANEKWTAGVEAGFATGDRTPGDGKYTTFVFDRDYNVALLMFEQPMPVFRADEGRNLEHTLSGNAIANALFARVRGTYELPEGLTAHASVVGARTFALPDTLAGARSIYGFELDAGVSYRATEHLDVVGTAAVFLPGSYYTNYADDLITDGLSGPVVGGQLIGRISF